MTRLAFFVLAMGLLACGNPTSGASRKTAEKQADPWAEAPVEKPPFRVQGDLEGLLLVWYDDQGAAHPAQKRSEVPAARRERVRIDSLEVPPEKRLDPAYVFVADLRNTGKDGEYPVRKVLRDRFEAAMSQAAVQGEHAQANDVIIYGASWCGACKQAARFLSQKGVPFVEKDIEKEPEARSEMLKKAQAQGVSTGGIPLIDVYGTLLSGFDPGRVESLIEQHKSRAL